MRATALGLLFTLALAARAGAEPVGLRTLLIDPGVAASGMGYAYTAVAEDPSALYWNPAGLAGGEPGLRGLLAHTEWLLDVRQEYAAVVWGRGADAFAAGINGWYVGDIERRDNDPVAEPLGTFGYYDIVVSLAYARAFGPIRAGVTAKPFYSKIELETAHGVAADFGVLYETPLAGLTLGGAAANLGNKPHYVDESFSLPVDLRGGAAWRHRFSGYPASILLSAEARKTKDDDTHGHFGAEIGLQETVAIRFGYKSGYDEESFAFGVGVTRGPYSFQVAVVPFESDLGTVSRFALGMRR
ncbi:MAG: PorV/PorQ family protein [Candidatus Eisenbacteria bacterium]|nr:PorV/PorQ family protein [Candidatus Eisenbacteria bacterium]